MFGLDVLGEMLFFPPGLWKLAGVLHVFVSFLVGATCSEVERVRGSSTSAFFERLEIWCPSFSLCYSSWTLLMPHFWMRWALPWKQLLIFYLKDLSYVNLNKFSNVGERLHRLCHMCFTVHLLIRSVIVLCGCISLLILEGRGENWGKFPVFLL